MQEPHKPPNSAETESRRNWMGLLARATPERLAALMPQPLPAHVLLRPPEVGAVMVQGRLGGNGAAFNLGEMTVTRCAVRLAGGAVGHGHVQGRSRDHARHAALVDALMQTAAAGALQRDLLTPLAAEEAARRQVRAEKAAATRVEFFTLVRGEDQ